MVVLTKVRQSPAYLYLKSYCLCALITIFQTTPVSSHLPRLSHRIQATGAGRCSVLDAEQKRNISQLEISESGHSKGESRLFRILARWRQRAIDLGQIKRLLRRDDKDVRTYPETGLDAVVRRSINLHPDEQKFIRLRQQRISCDGDKSLRQFLGLSEEETVDPRDVPLMALGGSGGGYRAMYGLAAFISTSKKLGLWDCLTWTGGVSGSCWTLAGYYTFAEQDISKLLKHYLSVAEECSHPLSIQALNTVARSSQGVYFLVGPLVRKAKSGNIGLVVMDLYATLTTTYQFLSRKPGAKLSRATFQFSKVWQRARLDQAAEPMPLLTAVRKAPPNETGVEPHADSSISKGRPPTRALDQHEMQLPHLIPSHLRRTEIVPKSISKLGEDEEAVVLDSSLTNGFFQWLEISPLEIGNTDFQGYIPTWAWGRAFASGKSIDRRPEQSLSLLLGQCTSAPAGPLTGYVSALLATIPKGTLMSRALLVLNNFIRMKRWEQFWGNPIRAGHDPNPFYGIPSKPIHDKTTWEPQTRIRLMDGGMSNNLPNHVLARPERHADIIIAFDASSDVQTGAATRRMYNFAEDCHIQLEDVTDTFDLPRPRYISGVNQTPSASAKVEGKFLHKYARVFRGIRQDGEELYVVYCPLLPNGTNPGFDPSVSVISLHSKHHIWAPLTLLTQTTSFSTSYNLVWTPEQIQTLFATSEANLTQYSINVIKQVTRQVYSKKKQQRRIEEEGRFGARPILDS